MTTTPRVQYPTLHEAEIKSDPDLHAEERETIIRFADADDFAAVYSENLSIMRGLRDHPKFAPLKLRVTDENRFGARILPDNFENDGLITGMKGKMPIGCLKISYPGRSENYPSGVVSNTVHNLAEE